MRTIQAVAHKVAVKQQVRYKERPFNGSKPRSKKKLRVVEDRRRQSVSLPDMPFPVFVMSVSVITAGIIINVAQQALVSQLSYQIESVKKDIQVAQQAQDQLLAQKSILESPQRIESVAVNKLLMVKAPKVSYLKIADDGQADASGNSASSSTNAVGKNGSATRDKAHIRGQDTAHGSLGGSAKAR